MVLPYLILGIVFGFGGTVLETIVVSLQKRRLVYKGAKYLFSLPIKPIYATGGMILYLLIKVGGGWEWFIVIPVTLIAITLWELIGGLFCVWILKDRLWDYTDKGWNIEGHISWWSTKWWLVLISIYYFFVHHKMLLLEEWLQSSVKISMFREQIVVIGIIGFVVLGVINVKVIGGSKN